VSWAFLFAGLLAQLRGYDNAVTQLLNENRVTGAVRGESALVFEK
jgi:hypothetical protein